MIQENDYLIHKLLSTIILRYISGQLLIVKCCHTLLQIETASIFSPCAHWRTIHGTSECYHELRGRENAINCTNALRSAAWFSANSSGRSQRQSAWLGATWTAWESGYVLRKFSLTTGNHSLTSFPSDSRCFFMKKNVDCETWKRYLYMTNVWREEAAWFFTWNKHWKDDLRIYDEEVD